MYNYLFNRHDLGINKLAQIHFTIFCFPSCQNDRGRFCSFLRGLAAPFPCGSLIDAFPGSSAGGSGFSPMIESISASISASNPGGVLLACQEGSASRQCIPGSARAHLPEDTRGLVFPGSGKTAPYRPRTGVPRLPGKNRGWRSRTPGKPVRAP